MIPFGKINLKYCLLLLTVSLVLPNTAWALQSHAAPEGIYVHQLAHIFFLAALCYLFWDVRRSSFPSQGWRFLQLFCIFMALWNIVAFTGHWVGESIEAHDIVKESGYLSAKILGPLTGSKALYYFTKLDHIFSVPAMVCLYLCLKSLYLTTCSEEKKMSGISMLPANLTDMAGSLVIIVFSFLSLRYAYLLKQKQPDNFLWGFLLYFCMTLAAFAVSRAMGHLVKQVLLISGNDMQWKVLAPFAGGFNTLLMTSLAAVTIYYHKGIEGYRAIETKAKSLKMTNEELEQTANQLHEMNIHLEEMVEDRTRELSASEKKFRNFFVNSKDMVYFCDAENRLVNMNASGLKMLGYSFSDPPPLNLHDLFLNEEDLDKYFEEIITRGFVEDLEVEFSRADGSVIYILLSATAVYNDDGDFTGCEGIAKDLTRVKTMMAQLASSEKMASIGQMAAGVAHEINTPLGVILGYSQLLMDDFPPDTEEGESLEVIERQTKACRKIVADLLKFSRQAESAKEDVSINDMLTDVLAVTEHSLNMDHIHVHKDLDSDLGTIVGDTERLRQVFINFINNAHHAMEKQGGGELYVSTENRNEGKDIVATIRDTGHGIPEKIRSSIFDPFFTTKPVGKGTGLGLSVSYGIVQEHGGIITVESPVIDKITGDEIEGTAFHVILPCSTDQSQVVKE